MQRIYTERAHLMCPNMCFGMVISVSAEYNESRILSTVESVAAAHPFLRSLLGSDETGKTYFYSVTEKPQVEVICTNTSVTGVDDKAVLDEFSSLTGREWDLRREGMLKLAAYRCGENTVFLLVFHHLLTDGRGALMLSDEFASCYAAGTEPRFVEEKLIASKADMPKDSQLPFISRMLVDRANRQWRKENHILSYDEYLSIANDFLTSDNVERSITVTADDEFISIVDDCHEHNVSVNDYLMASMYANDDTNKIIIAHDLRGELDCYNPGALGNYSTAFSVEYKDRKKDIRTSAQKIRSLVRKKISNPSDLYLVLQCYAELDPNLLDAAFVSARCGYDSKAARFIGSMFFGFAESKGHSITNLGRYESRYIDSAVFIPPASPATKKTLGVVTVNGKMITATAERKSCW